MAHAPASHQATYRNLPLLLGGLLGSFALLIGGITGAFLWRCARAQSNQMEPRAVIGVDFGVDHLAGRWMPSPRRRASPWRRNGQPTSLDEALRRARAGTT